MTADCEACGGPRPPGCAVRIDGERVPVCPGCEDRINAARTAPLGAMYGPTGPPRRPPGRGRAPPHGNTTR